MLSGMLVCRDTRQSLADWAQHQLQLQQQQQWSQMMACRISLTYPNTAAQVCGGHNAWTNHQQRYRQHTSICEVCRQHWYCKV